MINLNDDLQVLIATIWGEARGQPHAGKQAVASVIMNRVAEAKQGRKQFGDGSVASCCLAPYQFSCWNKNDPNYTACLSLNLSSDDPALADCKAIAVLALGKALTDNTKGALYYKVTSLPWPEDWGRQVEPTVTIDDQSFYRLAEDGPIQKKTIPPGSTGKMMPYVAVSPTPTTPDNSSQPAPKLTLFQRFCNWYLSL